ncbi:unnamed protein product, partial [Polarella glacialis]
MAGTSSGAAALAGVTTALDLVRTKGVLEFVGLAKGNAPLQVPFCGYIRCRVWTGSKWSHSDVALRGDILIISGRKLVGEEALILSGALVSVTEAFVTILCKAGGPLRLRFEQDEEADKFGTQVQSAAFLTQDMSQLADLAFERRRQIVERRSMPTLRTVQSEELIPGFEWQHDAAMGSSWSDGGAGENWQDAAVGSNWHEVAVGSSWHDAAVHAAGNNGWQDVGVGMTPRGSASGMSPRMGMIEHRSVGVGWSPRPGSGTCTPRGLPPASGRLALSRPPTPSDDTRQLVESTQVLRRKLAVPANVPLFNMSPAPSTADLAADPGQGGGRCREQLAVPANVPLFDMSPDPSTVDLAAVHRQVHVPAEDENEDLMANLRGLGEFCDSQESPRDPLSFASKVFHGLGLSPAKEKLK